MRVEQVQIPERPLIDAYRNDFDKVKEFFVYNPYDLKSFTQRYQHLLSKKFPRQEIVEVLTAYNREIGASEETFANIDRLADEKTVTVITGQQAGVLTGPLYTIYKALTVVNMANELTKKGFSAVPLFWIASEDHDFFEIAGVNFLDRNHQKTEVRLGARVVNVERQPIGRLNLPEEIEEFLDQFAHETPDTDFKPEMIQRLREMAKDSSNLAEWFGRIMAWLLSKTGIIFVDALLPELRYLGKEFFLNVFKKNDQITDRLKAAEKRLKDAGFPSQIHKNENQTHLFLIDQDARYPLDRANDGYQLRGKDEIYIEEEIRGWIEAGPERVSTNVVTRPIFQDLLFPTIAYVGGPGETAYYAQYREVYELFDMEMPIIYPRISITIIEKTIAKSLGKYNLTPLEVFHQFDLIREKHLAEADELNVKARFGQIKGMLIPEYQKLINDLQKLDPKFKKLGSQNLQRVIEEINYMEDKAAHQHRKNSELLLSHLDKIKSNLHPNGSFQERCFNIFPYLFKYQFDFIQELLKLDLLNSKGHNLLYI